MKFIKFIHAGKLMASETDAYIKEKHTINMMYMGLFFKYKGKLYNLSEYFTDSIDKNDMVRGMYDTLTIEVINTKHNLYVVREKYNG